jgi:sterol desaturase/sphingolipid hydroxylase (fatty acid hydroxylase superfamily)
MKNYIIVKILDVISNYYRKKQTEQFIDFEYDSPKISSYKLPTESYKNEFLIQMAKVSFLEFGAFEFVSQMIKFKKFYIFNDIVYFIPISFLYEIIFDFFHYWTHRFVHAYPKLYQKTHKLHHKHISLIPIITFMQDPIDLLITNLIPTILTICILQQANINISMFTYVWILMYKSYIEIAGHSGIQHTKSCSFPQFIWLPKLLNIELYAHDHQQHHIHPSSNFSKRFSLWDKIFGTWRTN